MKRSGEAQVARQKERGQRRRKAKDVPQLPHPKPVRRDPGHQRRFGVPDSPELTAMKREVRARSGGLCEANWEGVCPPGPHRGEHVHHVILRAQGGPDVAWNGLHLCAAVHTHAHDVDRAGANERGIIKRWRPVGPELPDGLGHLDP